MSAERLKMSACCWMFMILVGYRLSHATQSQSTCACNNQLKTLCVPAGDNVEVPCPEWAGEDIIFNLLRGQEMIYNHTYSHKKDVTSSEPPRVGVKLHENTENNTFSFVLPAVNASSHGVYRCEGLAMYPPPVKPVQSTSMILVLIEGHQCKVNKECDGTKTSGDQSWIWSLVLVLSILYSLIVTIIALVIWGKLRRLDSQSDYMNTKPRGPRDHKKKRGVQIPIPRHF